MVLVIIELKDKQILLDTLKDEKLIKNDEVLKAFKKIRREDFLPDYLKNLAYDDVSLPLNKNESMNQLSTTLFFIDILNPKEGNIIYEVGTGSGYSTAILSEIVGKKGKVISIELDKELYNKAKINLKNYSNVELILGNGLKGYSDKAPYDRIIIFGALDETPTNLINQMKVNGVLIYPKGIILQTLTKIIRKEKGIKKEQFGEFRLSKLIK
ncbi:MAG: protein-L-isoaspartate O-methyltransferase [Candidatus Nanoarchaeia archaeon]|nr:protein-L-isoaspartate O-methyltransferase [Candidatus Nanoarchaeia archaeon]